jgi:cytochrome c oxidase subunit IV
MEQQQDPSAVSAPNKSKVRLFIKVTLILFFVTVLEYIVAFTVPHEYQWVRVSVFIGLTIVKAYYIVSIFMHLLFEKKSLKMSIVLPMIFVVFFIAIMIYQGGALFEALYGE